MYIGTSTSGTYRITATETCTFDVTLYGAGGGDGGTDSYGAGKGKDGARGGPGDQVNFSVLVSEGDSIYVDVGGKGGDGVNYGIAGNPGGSGGISADGFSGGAGGNSGRAWSGSGGGGGGATVAWKYQVGYKKQLAVAAGGAGGGGGGKFTAGRSVPSSKNIAYRSKFYNRVIHSQAWSASMNRYAVNTSPWKSGARNGADGVLTYQFWSWETRTFIFYALADNLADVYLNGSLIGKAKPFNVAAAKFNARVVPGMNTITVYLTDISRTPAGFCGWMTTSGGTVVWHSRLPYNVSEKFYLIGRGGRGQTGVGDSAGAGGGGGGFLGGEGGYTVAGDNGGFSGYPGVSHVMDGFTFESVSTASIQSNWTSVEYGYVFAGGGASRRSNGYFTVSATSSSIFTKSGSWRNVKEVYYRQNNSWTPLSEIYVKHNDQWVSLFKGDTFSVSRSSSYNSRSTASGQEPDGTVVNKNSILGLVATDEYGQEIFRNQSNWGNWDYSGRGGWPSQAYSASQILENEADYYVPPPPVEWYWYGGDGDGDGSAGSGDSGGDCGGDSGCE